MRRRMSSRSDCAKLTLKGRIAVSPDVAGRMAVAPSPGLVAVFILVSGVVVVWDWQESEHRPSASATAERASARRPRERTSGTARVVLAVVVVVTSVMVGLLVWRGRSVRERASRFSAPIRTERGRVDSVEAASGHGGGRFRPDDGLHV